MDVDRTAWRSTLVKNHDENKTFILVKLSESFSNAIQEYSTPTIKFQGSRGAIKFPNGKNYDFSLEQQDRGVECVRQTKNRWEIVGKVACCLHVKGKDDVYQRTRTKMAAAEKEKRKYCTKLLCSPKQDSPATSATKVPTIVGSDNKPLTTAAPRSNGIENFNPKKYPDIKDSEQMQRYKADFEKDFQEYQQIHQYLQKIEQRFSKLKEHYEDLVEGSPEQEYAADEIKAEYERYKNNAQFHRARERYKLLCEKLRHIQRKMNQYKQENKDKNYGRRKRKMSIIKTIKSPT